MKKIKSVTLAKDFRTSFHELLTGYRLNKSIRAGGDYWANSEGTVTFSDYEIRDNLTGLFDIEYGRGLI